MKSSMLFAIGAALAWAALTPIRCQAQTEVSPDHFEMTNVEPFAQPTNAATANGGSVQKQIGGGGAREHLPFGFLQRMEACTYPESTHLGTECGRIDRPWKKLNAKLNGGLPAKQLRTSSRLGSACQRTQGHDHRLRKNTTFDADPHPEESRYRNEAFWGLDLVGQARIMPGANSICD